MAARILSYVMSGGLGTRLWPLSRQDNPKQFHDLAGSGSMLAATLRRAAARPSGDVSVKVIGAEQHAARIAADLAEAGVPGSLPILEPVARNTAPAVAVATHDALADSEDALVLVMPSDHAISTDAQFWQSVEAGVPAAGEGRLVVFGIAPERPETGYGYIEVGTAGKKPVREVLRFVEKPDLATAMDYLASGRFFWNSGIFLFSAATMRDAFLLHAPEIWEQAGRALCEAERGPTGIRLAPATYQAIEPDSFDYAVVEKLEAISMVEAAFGWSDLGSWQALLESAGGDADGNVVFGDVIAIDCRGSYLRSSGRLVAAIGLDGMAVVSSPDAIFVAPVEKSQEVKAVVERLEKSGRLETRFTPAHDAMPGPGAWRERVRGWLFDEALPRWSGEGVDRVHGGFHEALSLEGQPLGLPKRMRTMARQIYAFAVAGERGWDGPARKIIAHGVDFIKEHGRTPNGGWARVLEVDGRIADPTEDSYDHACVLLALAWAHKAGNPDAARLGEETLVFLDAHLEDERLTGFLEENGGRGLRRTNPHMHLLEAFLAWHRLTGERSHLRRAARIVDLFRGRFFDAESWTVGEYFNEDWSPAPGEKGQWTEPGHHFEWASLLVDFADLSGQSELVGLARKLYASAIANGLNRATGLAYGAVSREGMPLDRISRSWPQTEAIKAAIALDRAGGPDLKPEIEARMGRLFRWHIDPAPKGLWLDRIDERGKAISGPVPASILYHLVFAFAQYLDCTEGEARGAAAR
jgi:mannose-1-phosphate guanylyltransferase/mannose-6-phosphate isomerase